jgi:predicted amidohydrolase YtcJ
MNKNIRIIAVGALVVLVTTAQRSMNEPATLLILNAKVYPADGRGVFYEAVAVRGNRIVAVGTTAEIGKLRGPATEVLDARGAAVLPGFNDVHTHMLSGGLALDDVDLACSRTSSSSRPTCSSVRQRYAMTSP